MTQRNLPATAGRSSASLGTAPVARLLVRLAIPSILAQVVNALYNIIDRMYIGNIPEVGSAALTGVGVSFPLLIIITAFSGLVGMGGAPLAAIKMGEGDHEGAERIMGNCAGLLVIASLVLTVVFGLLRDPLLYAFGASGSTIGYGSSYLGIYLIGTLFVQLSVGLNAFISTQGLAVYSMATVMIGAVLNIGLDPLFIFVFGLGVQGAAIATVLSQGVSAAWVVWFLFSRRSRLKIRPRFLRLRKKVVASVLALGLSPFVMQSTESLVAISLNSSLQRYGGDVAVGSMTIMTSVMQFVMLPLFGLIQGAQPIISYNYGARKMDRVRRTFRLTLLASLGYTTLFFAAVMLAPQVFVRLFSSDAALTEATVWGMRIYFAAVFMLGAQIACQQTFVALGQARKSLFLALLRKIVLLIPLVFILPAFFEDKVFAVILAEPAADLIATSITILVFALSFSKILRAGDRPQAPSAQN